MLGTQGKGRRETAFLDARCARFQPDMIIRPALRFLTGPFPPGLFAARLFAAAIFPPLLFFLTIDPPF
jgi:hypothetical protein